MRARSAPAEILVLGDSHARVFGHWWFDVLFPLTRFRICAVGGATASGLENPNSKTQAYAQFRQELQSAADKHLVCLLGEVDTGFVIWFRAERRDGGVEQMLELALDTYCRFLKEAATVAASMTVISAPLPTIGDGAPRGEVAENRREVKATLRQRTDLTLKFNRLLGDRCRAHGFQFVDLDAPSTGPGGLVRPELLNPDPADHHFAFEPYARMIAWRLKRSLASGRRPFVGAPLRRGMTGRAAAATRLSRGSALQRSHGQSAAPIRATPRLVSPLRFRRLLEVCYKVCRL